MKAKIYFLSILLTGISLISLHGQNMFLVDLKIYLEGSYEGGEMKTDLNPVYLPLNQPYNAAPWNYAGTEQVATIPNPDVTDWILVELRETQGAPYTAFKDNAIAWQAGFVLKNGVITSTDGITPMQFDVQVDYKLFAVVHHRNHLSVMTPNELIKSGDTYFWDFTTDGSAAYGGVISHKQLAPGVWGMISSDGDANGQVNNFDKNEVWMIQAGSSGYLQADFDMDGQATNMDKNDYWVMNGGSSSQIPGFWLCGDSITDYRNGKKYSTVLIGTQCWMGENMDIGTKITSPQTDNSILEKYCYNNNVAFCDTFGGLYQWHEAVQYSTDTTPQGICPEGWHVPTDYEWKVLSGTVDSQYPVGDPVWELTYYRGFDAGVNLRSTTGWVFDKNGYDLYGFNATPAGRRYLNGNFGACHYMGVYWTGTAYDSMNSWLHSVYYPFDNLGRAAFDNNWGNSVRCLKD